jgi:hypothetical protein
MYFANFTDIKAISQFFWNFESTDGVIAIFGKQILLPINSRSLKDGSLVISLQSVIFKDQILCRYYKRYLQFRLICD